MKIYLAGSCGSEDRTQMKEIAKNLRSLDFEVYCPFELQIPNAWDMSQELWAKKVFEKDVEAINECDIMVSISKGRIGTAGTNWEQGYAYARGKKILVLQITNEPTSLMTFCGCSDFISSSKKLVLNDLYLYLKMEDRPRRVCQTVLT